ncbi:polyphosphate:AMP phosphotransferase [Oryzomicrobium sp.]|uniref:polyphosphate:AMP phosphotransferase n=1 Tax=Oryzomicrobium sp. TaxID=1911578 RepID=UPI0025FF2253|nr:polyphosphate:AMP phosphotransferase [Oryzomicrobium sp.]MCE1244935.1 polyphosphate:AMP phosphotransferase [Oryzomicrobium sp.]
MFESAELGQRVDKATYDAEVPQLRADLLDLQYDLLAARRFPVLILVNGLDGAGKGETVNLLNAWMDPRHIRTEGFGDPSDEERQRPPMWRYWRALPGKGRVGVFFGNWYAEPITGWVRKDMKRAAAAHHLERILRFEKMLADEGALILKLWFHLSRDEQERRLKTLSKDPKTAWRITDQDWWRFENYERYHRMAEYVLRRTSTAYAPWVVVDGFDPRYRALSVGRILASAIHRRLAMPDATQRIAAAPFQPVAGTGVNVLSALDLEQRLSKKKSYASELARWQGRLNQLVRDERFAKRSLVLVFEGNDAAGKGGAIRRVTGALDARSYRVVPIGAPSEEERDQPYLWRFWRHVPGHGRVTVFDRSWYGRVLVERVERFCSEADWMRAYSEINDFEDQLVRHGAVVVKFWLAISKDEQYRRFKEREETRFKRFKITDEDWRNREKWSDYETAVCQMVDRTSTEVAPWTLVEAEDKYFARIKVLKTVVRQLEAALDGDAV